jgi:hypothetical protein
VSEPKSLLRFCAQMTDSGLDMTTDLGLHGQTGVHRRHRRH